MNLLEQTKYLIKKTKITPDKLKGQNFCICQEVLDQMMTSAKLTNNDTVLEVGPGFGFLTAELVKKAGKVIAVELDKELNKNLKNFKSLNKNLEVYEGDILKISDQELGISEQESYKIVSNLPYGISSRFLRQFLTAQNKPKSITLLLQKELAERAAAKPGEMSLLAVSVQLYAQAQIVKIVPPNCFYPAPKVESAIIHIENIKSFPFAKEVDEKKYWQVVRSGFSSKRKTLENNLANSLHLSKQQVKEVLLESGLNPQARAQEFSINDWLDLTKKIG